MAKRLKTPAVPVPQTRIEFEELAARLGEITREIDGIKDAGSTKITAIKLSTTKAVEALTKDGKALWAAISAYAEAHRGALLPTGRKSAPIAAGIVGWRTSSPAIQVDGDEDDIILKMERSDEWRRFLREVTTLDRAALLAEPEEVAKIEGLSIVQVETLFFKPLDIENELTLKGVPTPVSEAA